MNQHTLASYLVIVHAVGCQYLPQGGPALLLLQPGVVGEGVRQVLRAARQHQYSKLSLRV
jgi:hypothetical protein